MYNKHIDFDHFTSNFGISKNQSALILIHHALPTHLDFFRKLSKLFNFSIFLPVPYSCKQDCIENLYSSFNEIKASATISELQLNLSTAISDLISDKMKFVIIEVGGYSVEILKNNKASIEKYLIGVIEDTENGHREHIKSLSENTLYWQAYSVARSPLKLGEDSLTGDAIVFSIEKVLRQEESLLTNKNVLVLGFGKIGKSISYALRGRKCNVFVFDNDPIKIIEAMSLGFCTGSKADLLGLSDILIGATGNYSIIENEFALIKNNCILCSGSSKQKEFNISDLKKNYTTKVTLTDVLDKYSNFDNHNLLLLFEGMPINFIDNGIIGSYLEIVWLEVLCLIKCLFEKDDKGLFELDEKSRKSIAEYWISLYNI